MAFPPLSFGDLVARMPIVQGGMGVGISLNRLAAAVANEGGIGVIAAAMIGMRESDVASDPLGANIRALQKEIRTARANSDGVLGVNIMVVLTDFSALVRTAIEERVDVIFTGAGKIFMAGNELGEFGEFYERGKATAYYDTIRNAYTGALEES